MSTHKHLLTTQSTVTTSGNVELPKNFGMNYVDGVFLLQVTADLTAAGDKLDVYIDHCYDSGLLDPDWDEFAHFAQAAGNGGATEAAPVSSLLFWNRGVSPETEGRAPTQNSLAASNVVQGPVHPDWRVRWVITSVDTPSFDFKVYFSGFDPLSSG